MRLLAGSVVFGLVLSTAAMGFAAPTPSVVPVAANQKVESAILRADGVSGRAWVEVTLASRFLSGKDVRRPGTKVRVAIPGLSFDRATGAIKLASRDGQITCATVGTRVEMTGACRIDAGVQVVAVDTGFEVESRDGLVVSVTPR